MTKAISLKLVLFAFTVPLAVTPVLAAGSHSGGHGHLEFGGPGDPSAVSRTIQVGLEDTYFEPETIQIKAGETIRFVLKNNGQLVHEFNIGTASMHTEHQEEMEMMVDHGVLEADKINHHMMKMEMADGTTMEHDDPNSALLEPGQEAEIVWTFAKPMELEFACNIPGHYDAGMAGSFKFVEKLARK